MEGRNAGDNKLLAAISFTFLTYNSVAAVYRSLGDPHAVSFVVIAYIDLLLLYWCLGKLEAADEGRREMFKALVWVLATLLIGIFTHKVGAVLPWPAALFIYCMATVTAGSGFWVFFLYRQGTVL